MHILGMGISIIALLLDGLLIVKGVGSRVFRLFPVFYSYLVFAFCGSLGMYLIYWLYPYVYPSAYWMYYLVIILAEFMILVEVSDQIFRPFPAIRYLGRALTVVISFALGLVYILPAILGSTHRRPALLAFALRACVTKAIILVVLFCVARHYCSQLGRNVGGLMLGFSIYVALNIAMLATGNTLNSVLSANILWLMEPLASALCLLVWVVSLWEVVPIPSVAATAPVAGRNPEAVALELTRFNSQLSKLLHK